MTINSFIIPIPQFIIPKNFKDIENCVSFLLLTKKVYNCRLLTSLPFPFPPHPDTSILSMNQSHTYSYNTVDM